MKANAWRVFMALVVLGFTVGTAQAMDFII